MYFVYLKSIFLLLLAATTLSCSQAPSEQKKRETDEEITKALGSPVIRMSNFLSTHGLDFIGGMLIACSPQIYEDFPTGTLRTPKENLELFKKHACEKTPRASEIYPVIYLANPPLDKDGLPRLLIKIRLRGVGDQPPFTLFEYDAASQIGSFTRNEMRLGARTSPLTLAQFPTSYAQGSTYTLEVEFTETLENRSFSHSQAIEVISGVS